MTQPEADEPSETNTPALERPLLTRNGARLQLDWNEFPHQPQGGSSKLPQTIENLDHLLAATGTRLCFDVIKKRVDCRRDDQPVTITTIASLAGQYGLCSGWFYPFVQEIAERNPVNRVRDWIESLPWDGTDRLPEIYATVQTAEDYPPLLKDALIYRWLLGATAAATTEAKRFSTPGVLTLQGAQGIGKTSWISSLMPAGALRDDVIKRDHHLDGSNKDSILGAIAHWIVEIGELDSSFRKDVARLKGFLTNDCDRIRPPYGRHAVEYDRRTVFAATVNEETFLVDSTGNRRFWTVAAEALDFNHGIDMQQLFAQLARKLHDGEQWWLTQDEEVMLAAYNQRHRAVSAIVERVKDVLAFDRIGRDDAPYMTAIELLRHIGIGNPSNVQCKECGSCLRELLGKPKRVQGRDKWRVPLNRQFEQKEPINLPHEEF